MVIVFDDAAYEDFPSFYEEATIELPEIDAFAAEGMKFTRHYTGGSLCSPTRAAMLSGEPAPSHGISRAISGSTMRGMPGRVFTLAEQLKGEEHTTGQFGKWHIGDARREFTALEQGFDTSVVTPAAT